MIILAQVDSDNPLDVIFLRVEIFSVFKTTFLFPVLRAKQKEFALFDVMPKSETIIMFRYVRCFTHAIHIKESQINPQITIITFCELTRSLFVFLFFFPLSRFRVCFN